MESNTNPVRIGLALSGGGARAIAHLGVLQVLEEHGIPISIIAGTSMGAYIGGSYAAGASLNAIEEVVSDIGSHKILTWGNFNILRESLIKPNKMEDHWRPLVGDTLTENTKIPFSATATDLESGKEVDLSSGPLIKVMMASGAYPTIFPPVFLNEHYLIDGGILNYIPVNMIRDKCDIVLAVDLESQSARQFISAMAYDKFYRQLSGWRKILHFKRWITSQWRLNLLLMANIVVRTIDIARRETFERKLFEGRPDLLIVPETEGYPFFGFKFYKELIQAGRDSMEKYMPLLKAMIVDEQKKKESASV